MKKAVQKGDLASVQLIHKVHPEPFGIGVFEFATEHGNLELLQWLLNNRWDGLCCSKPPSQCIKGTAECYLYDASLNAIEEGHFQIVKFMVDEKYTAVSDNIGISTAKFGDLDTLQRFFPPTQSSQFRSHAYTSSVQEGHIHILRFLHEHTEIENRWAQDLRDYATVKRHKGVAAYLRHSDICTDASPRIIEKACHAGRQDLVQEYDHFLQASSQVTKVALITSIGLGHLDIIQWIWSRHWERITEPVSLYGAAASGHLNVLQWFHDNDEGDWTHDLMKCAARHGQLSTLQWLHLHRSEGCTSSAMDSAARNGYLETVMWLHTNRSEGCTTKAMDDAARGGHLEMVKWLHMNRSEGCTTQAMDLAAKNGHVEILQWLHVHRTEGFTAQAIMGAVNYDHLGVTQWLCSKRPDLLAAGPLQEAIFNGNFAITAYLYPHFDRGVGSEIVLKAVVCGHVPMLQWLCERFPGQVDYRQIRTIATRYGKCPQVEKWLASIDKGEPVCVT